MTLLFSMHLWKGVGWSWGGRCILGKLHEQNHMYKLFLLFKKHTSAYEVIFVNLYLVNAD